MTKKQTRNKNRSWWKKAISKDANILTKITRTLLLTSTLVVSFPMAVSYMTPSRPLTDNEEKVLQDMGYKSSIDVEKIRIHKSDIMDKFLNVSGALAITMGSHVFVESNNYANDFSKEKGIKEHVFKHEMGHVWQYQACRFSTTLKTIANNFNMIVSKGNIEDLYNYKLDSNKDLRDYGIEQQAEILSNLGSSNNEDEYASVVDKFKNNPSYAKNGCF